MNAAILKICLASAIALGAAIGVYGQSASAHKLKGNFAAGKEAFPRYCNGCHGVPPIVVSWGRIGHY